MSTTPKTLTVTECHQLLDALLVKNGTQKQFHKGIRNYAMALLMLDAGLRVGEVVRLKQTDLYFGTWPVASLTISAAIAKNKTERTIPLSSRITDAASQMHKDWWRRDKGRWSGFAFYQQNSSIPLTTRQVERIIRAAAMKSINRPVHPHMLRHTFGTRIERKAGMRIAQECLGHKNITSTQIYTHPNEDDKMKAIQSLDHEGVPFANHEPDSALDHSVANGLDTPSADGDVG